MATAEVINISQPHVSAPPESCMIFTSDLWKTYDMGSEQQVHALRGVNLQIRRGEYVTLEDVEHDLDRPALPRRRKTT